MMPEQPPGRTAPRDGEAPLRHMLLTGASRGIGHATVKLFQERGWRILTVSRQLPSLLAPQILTQGCSPLINAGPEVVRARTIFAA